MSNEKSIRRLVAGMPPLTNQAREETNNLFPSYIFRVRRNREIWTTCCRKHLVLPDEKWSEAEDAIMEAPHTRAPKWSWGMEIKRPEKVPCPYCGRMAEVKELGRTGDRKNLWCCRRSVILRQWRGALWAVAYDCEKDYGGDRLTAEPSYHAIGIYRFQLGFAEGTSRPWWGNCCWTTYKSQQQPPKSGGHWLSDPYGYNNQEGTGYSVVCQSEIKKSAFRYCCGDQFSRISNDFIEFLAVCCFYPRQIEMLMKAGMIQPVRDLVERGCYNKKAFSWEEMNPIKAFGLSKPELKEFAAGKKDIAELACYKGLKKSGVQATFEDISAIHNFCVDSNLERIVSRLRKYKLKPEKLMRYLEREVGKQKKPQPMQTMLQSWLDYVLAAEIVKLDLNNSIFLTPRNLIKKHDEITKAAEAFAVKTVDKNYRKNRLRNLVKRYTFSDQWYLIRPPISAAEIVAEGKSLRHCVGGYADRHIEGSTTILFLRERKRPGKPFVTIEMRGNQIQQIYGFGNDRGSHINQRNARKSILEPWLKWLKGGSKRNKKRAPVLPRSQQKVEVQIA